MKSDEVARHRRRVVPAAEGRVLEIGFGFGLNLPFYGPGVTAVVGVDPSAPLARMATTQRDAAPFPVDVVTAPAEEMLLDDASFDSAIVTWSLCTIPDAVAALVQVRRILKPSGRLLFIGHGASPDPRVAVWQGRINPLWRQLAGGCNINRAIDHLVAEAGFRIERLETGCVVKGPKVLTFTYDGSARAA